MHSIFIVDLPQDRIGEVQAVHFPMGMPFSIIIEILIAGLRHPEIGVILLSIIIVFSH